MNPVKRISQPSQTITVTNTQLNRQIDNSKQNKTFNGTPRRINNVKNIVTTRNQLVNTYLTFAYEMRTGLESRIFWRYVILLMYSIDKIAGVSTNEERNVRLFQAAAGLQGVVSDQEQKIWSDIFLNLIRNIKNISPTTTLSMYNRLPIK